MSKQENPIFKSFYEFGKWWFGRYSNERFSRHELKKHMRENRCVGYHYGA